MSSRPFKGEAGGVRLHGKEQHSRGRQVRKIRTRRTNGGNAHSSSSIAATEGTEKFVHQHSSRIRVRTNKYKAAVVMEHPTRCYTAEGGGVRQRKVYASSGAFSFVYSYVVSSSPTLAQHRTPTTITTSIVLIVGKRAIGKAG